MSSFAAIQLARAEPDYGGNRAQAKDERAMPAKTTLVVDDSRSARFAMRRFLENLGYGVDTAASAEEALAYLQTRIPEVVFLDHLMPGTDGLMALQAIKQDARTAQLPVVLCSSNEAAEFLRQARVFGALEVLPKPPSTEQLRAVLERVEQLRKDIAAAPASPPPEAEPVTQALVEEAPAPVVAVPISEPAEEPVGAELQTLPVTATPAPAVPTPEAAPAPELTAAPAAFEFEARLQGLADDFNMQLAGLREHPGSYEPLGAASAAAAQAQSQAQAAAEQSIAAIARDFGGRLAALRVDFDAALQQRVEHVEQLLQQRVQQLEQLLQQQSYRFDEELLNQSQRVENVLQEQSQHFVTVLKEQAERFEHILQEQSRQQEALEARLRQELAAQPATVAASIAERLVQALRDGLLPTE